MTDVKILNGDVYTDSTGKFVRISDNDVLFQRALICIGARAGSFVYDRSLGSSVREIDSADENSAQKAELAVNEAIAQFENTHAEITEFGNKMKINLIIGDESRTEEVLLNGNV